MRNKSCHSVPVFLSLCLLITFQFLVSACSKDDEKEAPVLEVSPENLQLSSNGEGTLTITSNGQWSISTTADWLSFSTMSGVGNCDVTVQANGIRTLDRMAIVTIKADNVSRQVVVSQKGVLAENNGTLIVNVYEAGVFPTLIDGRKNTTTRMKIIGSLNGTDIISLRDMMMSDRGGHLSYLDLSDASIVEGGEPYRNPSGEYTYTTKNNIISDDMFDSCDVIQELILPNSVVKISSDIFGVKAKSNIRTITIGQFTIGAIDSFYDVHDLDFKESLGTLAWMSELEEIIVHPDNPKYSSENGVMYNKDKTILYHVPPKYKKMLSLPNSLTTIGSHSFVRYSASSVKLPNSVKILEGWAFAYSNLRSIDIGTSVVEIGKSAFVDCNKLESLYIGSPKPPSVSLDMKSVYDIFSHYIKLYVPKGSKDRYASTIPWSELNIIEN